MVKMLQLGHTWAQCYFYSGKNATVRSLILGHKVAVVPMRHAQIIADKQVKQQRERVRK